MKNGLREFHVPKEELKRENLSPLIKDLLQDKYDFPMSNSDVIEHLKSLKTSEEIEAFDGSLKVERAAIIAILISRIWEDPDFAKTRTELVESNEVISIADFVQGHETDVFDSAVATWCKNVEQGKGDGKDEIIRKLWDRHKTLSVVHARMRRVQVEPDVDIMRGVHTAATVAWALSRAVLSKIKEKELNLSNEDVLSIIARAHERIGQIMARIHLDTFALFFSHLNDSDSPVSRFKEDLFELVEEQPGKFVLIVKREAIIKLLGSQPDFFSEYDNIGPTTQCPACYRVEGRPDVASLYFAWHQDLLRHRYLPHVRGTKR